MACLNCKAENSFVSTDEHEEVCRECGVVSSTLLVGKYNKYETGNTIFDKLDKRGTKRSRPEQADGQKIDMGEIESPDQAEIKTTYKRIFHFNERLAQLNVCEPAIPLELFNLIVQKYRKCRQIKKQKIGELTPDELTKDDIRALCGAIDIPPQLQEKYASKKFKCQKHQ